MAAIMLYLVKAHVALLLFAAAYFGLLRHLTFFALNRVYLVAALLFAAAYPALPIPALLPAEVTEPVAVILVQGGTGQVGSVARVDSAPFNWQAATLALYGGGIVVLLGRLVLQLLSVRRLRRVSRPAIVNGQAVRVLADALSPFSFGQTIYLNPAQHSGAELVAVLTHEQVHVRQWHTLDVLLAQVVVAAAWCNPAAWLLRHAILDNLEYLADGAVLQTGFDRQAYQLCLLRLSHSLAGPTLVSPFTFSTLKNRVVMMNTPFSSTGQLVRYVVAGPLVLAITLGLSAARAQRPEPTTNTGTTVKTSAELDVVPPSPKQESTEATKGSQLPALALAESATKPTVEANQRATHKATPRPTQLLQLTKAQLPVAKVETAEEKPVASSASPALSFSQASKQPPMYYVDGQLYTADINDIKPNDIAFINVFKGERALQLFGETISASVVAITTKQNSNKPDVQAFNSKIGAVAPAAPQPDRVAYLAAPALAYIVKNYPAARLTEVSEVLADDGKTPQYRAEIVLGRRPLYLLFDGQGTFISVLPYNRFTR
jgi:hypothetical protein